MKRPDADKPNVAKRGPVRPNAARPEANRFTRVVLAEKLNEPMALAPLEDGRVLFIERKGTIHQYNPTTNRISVVATIPVNTTYTNREGKVREAEDGLLGIVPDPNFVQNHWLYLYYSDPDASKNVLARYEMLDDRLVIESKKVLLEIPTQREECCHTGGGMVFDPQGNLYLLTGDNTSPFSSLVSGYAPIDERPGRSAWDAQKSSSNTNDLRGKLIRIHPEQDGSYTIPKGNLFAEGQPNGSDPGGEARRTRPEIYGMGLRNPWRLSRDSRTGYVYWGEVGPDMKDSVGLGPYGYDEFNQARKAGNFGWPYVVGNNAAYWDRDYTTGKVGAQFNPAKLINDSPNNTGLRELPPAQKALIWYSHRASDEFPLMGNGGRSAVGGPIYHKSDFKNAQRPFPDYYEGKWLITDFMRGWIMSVTLDAQSNYVAMERFLPNERFDSPIDMRFAPSGDLYLLEYGSAWFQGNDNARLVRIEYNSGNRKPVAQASADKTAGVVPLNIAFSSAGSTDYDHDTLIYEWQTTPKAGGTIQTFTSANPTVQFDKAGVYTARLTVTDAKGASNSKTLEIKAGNEPPAVAITLKGNQTFFFPNQSIEYAVSVSDREDGSLSNPAQITPDQVAVSMEYLPERFDRVTVAMNQRSADMTASYATAQRLISESDCRACHSINRPSVGPAYQHIARKYKGDPNAVERLARKVISGGSGIWSEATMSAHPQLSLTDASTIVTYILSLSEEPKTAKSLPTSGSYPFIIPEGQTSTGVFIFRAAYTDKGAPDVSPISAEKVVVLLSPVLLPEQADTTKGTEQTTAQNRPFYMIGSGAYLGYSQLDLTGIDHIDVAAQAPARADAAGGIVEMRLDSPAGKRVGESPMISSRTPGLSAGSSTTQRSTITIQSAPIAGIHDVYFVVKNPAARPNQVLLQLTSITFKPADVTK
ncbi:PQQ-dependent sugar dehydrogenase [Spirosoma sp. BT704]|uniref:PQQ-dependent sugar dehydrogenase n=2 Tax=Spirosoma validum TaxID=2771355 RepID=A0A927GCY0_9BACT|nr:PQQ-dependent sugar dehydrogenase [Spirosoma validum]